MEALKLAESVQPQVVAWRRDLHKIPEIGNELPKTSKYVQDVLTKLGIPFVTMVNGSGIMADIQGGNPGKTLALRADMDALPVLEEAPIDFKAENGNMHACGHDAHTAILLGAAKILNENKAGLKGNIRLIFQPGEESPGGAKPMIAQGVLKGVDAIFGLHVGCIVAEVMTSGKISVSHGAVLACRDKFKIKIIGRGGHGAFPEMCIDPITAAGQVINGIYMIKARECPALSPAVISIGMVHGGSAGNIIPGEVELEGSTRSVDPELRKHIARRIEEVVKNTCLAFGARHEFEYEYDYDITANNPAMADLVVAAANDLGFGDDLIPQPQASMGSEDMSFYLNEVPGAFFFLSSIVEQDGVVYGHHNSKFMLDESVFSRGVAMFVQLASDFLK